MSIRTHTYNGGFAGLRGARRGKHLGLGAASAVLMTSAIAAFGAATTASAATQTVHIQVQGSPSCRSNSSSDLWKTNTGLPSTAGTFQIADAANKEMFVTGGDGKVYHNYIDPTNGPVGWSSLGGPAAGIFGSVRNGTNYLGNQELFVRSTDGLVYHLFSTPGVGSGWRGWDPLGAPGFGIRGDVVEGTNYLKNQELYVLGKDGDVYHKFSTPGVGTGWSGWDTLSHPAGVTVVGDVQIGTNYLCNQELYVTGTDGNTYHKFSTPGIGTGWSEWDSLSKPAVGVSGPVATGENFASNQELFSIGSDGQVYHDYSTPGIGSGWSGWGSLGAPPGTMTSTSVIVDTYPIETLTVTTSSGSYVDTSTPGQGNGWSGWTPGSGISPTAGFTDTTLAASVGNPLSSPTTIVSIDGSRALVLQKGGAVRVLQADGTLVTNNALTLSVCTASEEGLLGAAVDPSFATNGFVYLYYTANKSGCTANTTQLSNQVSRFKMTGDTIDPASKLVLLDNLYIPQGNHNGGGLRFGNDGDLYVAIGDGGTNPRGSGPSAAQDLSLLNGKILRITTSALGGVPADNPFVGDPNARDCSTTGITTVKNVDKCTQIYAYGLRNPYRFAFDPNTTNKFYINDVGQSTWEEVDAGGKGLNYGWDIREGPCVNGSSSNCGATPAGYTDPLTSYNHSSGCIFVTAGAFVPNGIWPAQYDDSYLFADGGCGNIFQLTPTNTVSYGNPFAQTTGKIVDMTFLSQGGQMGLYYVTNGSSQIHKIVYHS